MITSHIPKYFFVILLPRKEFSILLLGPAAVSDLQRIAEKLEFRKIFKIFKMYLLMWLLKIH